VENVPLQEAARDQWMALPLFSRRCDEVQKRGRKAADARHRVEREVMLGFLQAKIAEHWTGQVLQQGVPGSTCPYKDFQHAIMHRAEGGNKLMEMVEEADHTGHEGAFPGKRSRVRGGPRDLAPVRLANKAPGAR